MIILQFLLIILGLVVSRSYAEDDGRLPAASTPKGKIARLLLLSIASIILITIVADHVNGTIRYSRFWIPALLVALGLPVIRFVLFKRKNKEETKPDTINLRPTANQGANKKAHKNR